MNTPSIPGYKPLVLPEKGEDLQEGRQYLLTPLARDMLDKEFGYRGVPTVVVCIRRKVAKTCIRTHTENIETGESKWTVLELDGQQATFQAFMGLRKILSFVLDLAEMDKRAAIYAESHVIPESMVDEWKEETKKYPLHRKFRGCTLRWWEQGHETHVGSAARISATRTPKAKIDLTVLMW